MKIKPSIYKAGSHTEDWDTRILLEKVTDGVAVTTANFMVSNKNIDELDKNIKEFVKNVTKKIHLKFTLIYHKVYIF